MARYQLYDYADNENRKITVAISTYAGKKVKGYATCDPADEYNAKSGAELAIARCDKKVASRRVKRAKACFEEAQREYEKALRHLQDMCIYYSDAIEREVDAKLHVEEVLRSL